MRLWYIILAIFFINVRAHVLRKEGLRQTRAAIEKAVPHSQSACSKERRTETPNNRARMKFIAVRAHVLEKEGLRTPLLVFLSLEQAVRAHVLRKEGLRPLGLGCGTCCIIVRRMF